MSTPEPIEDFIVRLKVDENAMPKAPYVVPTSMSVARIAEKHPCLRCGHPSQAALHSDHELFGPRWLDLCFPCYMEFVQASDGRK
jgi:hypothetical protein